LKIFSLHLYLTDMYVHSLTEKGSKQWKSLSFYVDRLYER